MVHQCCLKKKPKGLLIIYIGPEVLITKSVYCIKCDCYMHVHVHWCAEQVGADQITGQIPK